MLKTQFLNLSAPPEVLAPEGSSSVKVPKTADDINDLFRDLDTEKPISDKEPAKEKESKKEKEESEEEQEDELELVEADEEIEKLDLKEPDEELNIEISPRKKEILKKYPDIFKDFPYLEKAMFRDKQISELFGSFDDAKEIAEKSETFNNFESQLLSGNTEEILRGVKEADEKAFNIIVDDYLPTLAKVDKEAYFHVVGNLNKRLIMEMVQEANDTDNDDLKNAALLVNQFVFGSAKFTAPTNRVEKRSEADKSEAEQERLSFVKERFESSRDDLQSRVDNTLRATITEYIDPRGNMSAYEKKNAINDAMTLLSNSIANDASVVKNLDRLWRAAFDSKFSKESLGRIQSFYLSKAKGNLKNAILKARAEVLKNAQPRTKREKDDVDEEETPRTLRKSIPTGRTSQPQNKNGMRKGESVADFFARD